MYDETPFFGNRDLFKISLIQPAAPPDEKRSRSLRTRLDDHPWIKSRPSIQTIWYVMSLKLSLFSLRKWGYIYAPPWAYGGPRKIYFNPIKKHLKHIRWVFIGYISPFKGLQQRVETAKSVQKLLEVDL